MTFELFTILARVSFVILVLGLIIYNFLIPALQDYKDEPATDEHQKDESVKFEPARHHVEDVTAYILSKTGSIGKAKLHKILYYCQAWGLVWDGESIFDEPITTGATGPKIQRLIELHQGLLRIDEDIHRTRCPESDRDYVGPPAAESIDAVLKYYGHRDSTWLADLSMEEDPYRLACGDHYPFKEGEVITNEAMYRYYKTIAGER